MTQNLFKSIYSYFIATPHNSFYTSVSGRMDFDKAHDDWADNFAIVHATSINQNDLFRTEIDDVYFQINMFSTSRATCWNIMEYCRALYHGASLTVAGHYKVRITRENQVPPIWNEQDNFWQAAIEFRCMLQPT